MIHMDLLTECKMWILGGFMVSFFNSILRNINVMITIQHSKCEKIEKQVTGLNFLKIKNSLLKMLFQISFDAEISFVALHWHYVILQIYNLVFIFPRDKCITLIAFCCVIHFCVVMMSARSFFIFIFLMENQ